MKLSIFTAGISLQLVLLLLAGCSGNSTGGEEIFSLRPSAAASKAAQEEDIASGGENGGPTTNYAAFGEGQEPVDDFSSPDKLSGMDKLSGRDKGELDYPDSETAPGKGEIVEADQEPYAAPIVPAFPAQRIITNEGNLQRVHFDFDSAGLNEATKRMLDANIKKIKENPNIQVRLQGHADERGTSEYNLGLGMRRAYTVQDYLILRGVDRSLLATVTFGEEIPIKRGHNEKSYRINRRVEFSLAEPLAQR